MTILAGDGRETSYQSMPSTALGPGAVVAASTITVIGKAKVRSAPDEAVVTLTVEADAPEPESAMNANSAAVMKVRERLRLEGVEGEAIETSNVSVFPVRTYNPQTGQESLTGYRSQKTVAVTLRDADMVGKLLAAAIEAGATNISGPVWRLAQDTAAVAEALKQAVADARAKAEVLAGAQGVGLGQVIMMSEGGVERPVVVARAEMFEVAKATSAAGVDAIPISTPTLDVTATVTVTYSLSL